MQTGMNTPLPTASTAIAVTKQLLAEHAKVVITDPKATLKATNGKDALDLRAGDDFAGTSHTQAGDVAFDAPAVFVGHGITAPELGWDDYAGVDVKGKWVMIMVNDPPAPADEPTPRQ